MKKWLWIHLPWWNLGCLGFRITPWLYFDFFRTFRVPYFGMFWRVGNRSWYVTRKGVSRNS